MELRDRIKKVVLRLSGTGDSRGFIREIMEEIEATESQAPSGQTEFDLLGDLRTPVAKDDMAKLITDLKYKKYLHETGELVLTPDAYKNIQNDVEILVKLGL